MEAAVADREAEMTEWNDARLDDLGKKVDDGFAHVDRRFEQVDQKFEQVNEKIDEQGQAMRKEFARVDQKFVKIDGQFERVGERFDEFGRRFDGLESGMVRINDRLDGFRRILFQAAVTFVVGSLGLIGLLIGVGAN
jgi:predicted nuclease with TOPRIM domain